MKKTSFVILAILLLTACATYPPPSHAGVLLSYPKFKAWDSNGDPLAGGKLYTYAAGTSTAQPSYSDKACTTPNANPVPLDSNGEAIVYLLGRYKLVLKDSDDTTLWTIDEVSGAEETGVYYVDLTETDQGTTGNGSSYYDIMTDIGTTKRATVVLTHYPSLGNTTTYTFTTSADFTNYSNVTTIIEPGAVLDVDDDLVIGGSVEATGYAFDVAAGKKAQLLSAPIDMRWFGVSHTASAANNDTYMQRAVDALSDTGGEIYLTYPGTYQTDGGTSLTTSNIHFWSGPGVRIQTTGDVDIFDIAGTSASKRIENVTFEGNGAVLDGNSLGSTAIYATYCDDIKISGWQIDHFNVGIRVNGNGTTPNSVGVSSYKAWIQDNRVSNVLYGIDVEEAYEAVISHNIVIGASTVGIAVANCGDFGIHGNIIRSGSGDGIKVSNSASGVASEGSISGNVIRDVNADGIEVHQTTAGGGFGRFSEVAITGNQIYNTTNAGITADGASDSYTMTGLTITGNTIYYADDEGINVQTADYVTITGNVIRDPIDQCIELEGVTHFTILGNSCSGAGAAGLTDPCVTLAKDGDNKTLYGTISGNLLMVDDYATYGIDDGGVSGTGGTQTDYISVGDNNYGQANPENKVRLSAGPHNEVLIIPYDSTITTTSTASADTYTLYTATVQGGVGSVYHLRAGGEIRNANGNKTIECYVAGTMLSESIHDAANDQLDWNIDATIHVESTSVIKVVYAPSDDTGQVYYQEISQNMVDAEVNIAITALTANASDFIDLQYAILERIK